MLSEASDLSLSGTPPRTRRKKTKEERAAPRRHSHKNKVLSSTTAEGASPPQLSAAQSADLSSEYEGSSNVLLTQVRDYELIIRTCRTT